MRLIVHTDGGARGNPGPGAIGVVIASEGKRVAAFGKKIGETTNNVAEYRAVVEALRWINDQRRTMNDITEVQFILDSVLVTNQLMGRFKVKDPDLRLLLFEIRQLEQELGGHISYAVVPRAQNAAADALVNQALDN